MAYNLDALKRLQSPAILNQATPVQNTWYTIIDTSGDLEIYGCSIAIQTTGETLEVRITIDGVNPNNLTQIAVAGTNYKVSIDHDYTGIWLSAAAGNLIVHGYSSLKCHTFKAEVRKTTAAGGGNLRGMVSYSRG